ncbi:hypothetical protein I4F81_011541 [Pyropia yezoensis]|uniref:Uncharacterized protein n=1 Tax=Pyropia yezoensis TaxID=2788 RepID=A0ACC3CFJ9_PYRYE|nr:hypothetical protein I4F81_011541 [Neopyropia yezoensis]
MEGLAHDLQLASSSGKPTCHAGPCREAFSVPVSLLAAVQGGPHRDIRVQRQVCAAYRSICPLIPFLRLTQSPNLTPFPVLFCPLTAHKRLTPWRPLPPCTPCRLPSPLPASPPPPLLSPPLPHPSPPSLRPWRTLPSGTLPRPFPMVRRPWPGAALATATSVATAVAVVVVAVAVVVVAVAAAVVAAAAEVAAAAAPVATATAPRGHRLPRTTAGTSRKPRRWS